MNKALLEHADPNSPDFVENYVKPWIRTYGYESEKESFDKTEELVKEIGEFEAANNRKRAHINAAKESLRIDFLKAALAQHLHKGRRLVLFFCFVLFCACMTLMSHHAR